MYKQEYSTIAGRTANQSLIAIHINIDDEMKCARLDMTKPVTLKRLQEVAAKLKTHTGEDYEYLDIHHVIYQYDGDKETVEEYIKCNDYYPHTQPIDKTYKFWVKENRLLILDRGELVYENNNGVICNDPTALADSYC
ncbi:hypothetical protein A6046_03450 [[Haemophilus] ducreyi]|uniref:hypothetical protein n=1 Tax=Haemophilus ducreyi TaxID=730 RepID=UPI0007CDB082|nr:hypothetical protein [[Haemophilus] ducreyi]ANF73174.1 hypothetical protein A6045_01375 [[Haemophilus] ducreyi]ANF75112.1 hypothetical protein A6046_03450 [[Haemophilus] ducreyi]